MMNTGYLYSKDNIRIFVNTCLGCTGKCSYCYLGKMGYDNNKIVSEVKEAEELIDEIERKVLISKETLITLGCFSECWDDNNKPQTIKLIKYFLKRGNQIQLSTKKKIIPEEMSEISEFVQYLGQLVIFVSSATISKWSEFEKGTDEPDKRFETFNISAQLPIPTVLYMKPILKGITIQDIDLYKQVIQKYGIKDVVVGSIFGEKETGEPVHFSNERKLFYNPIEEEFEIKRKLLESGKTRVFSRSTETMKYYKDRLQEKIK